MVTPKDFVDRLKSYDYTTCPRFFWFRPIFSHYNLHIETFLYKNVETENSQNVKNVLRTNPG